MKKEGNEEPAVYTWGWGKEGQLGQGNRDDKLRPKILSLKDIRVTEISAGLSHTLFVTDTGEMFTFGKGSYGRLGLGDEADHTLPTRVVINFGKSAPRVIRISCGHFHSTAITTKGELFTWGRNDRGQLGHGANQNSLWPKHVETLRGKKIVSIACGSSHSMASTANDELFIWGRGQSGELGLGNRVDQYEPKRLEIPNTEGQKILSIACGLNTSAVVLNGTLYTWGANEMGQLGRGSSNAIEDTPGKVEGPMGSIVQVSLGGIHGGLVTERGEVWMFGSGQYGQLGIGLQAQLAGDKAIYNKPMRVKESLWDISVTKLCCGSYHTVALGLGLEKGIGSGVWVWGLNDQGQLGVGNTDNKFSPISLKFPTPISNIGAGGRHSIAAFNTPFIRAIPTEFSKEIQSLLELPETSDVSIKVKLANSSDVAHEIRAHRIILGRSPFLFQFFKENPKETSLELIDEFPEFVVYFVQFLYNSQNYFPNPKLQELHKKHSKSFLEIVGAIARRFQMDEFFFHCRKFVELSQEMGGDGRAVADFLKIEEYLWEKFETGLFSDVNFSIAEKTFSAHKCILAARSEKFRGELFGHFKESSMKEIPVENFPASAFHSLLHFIYTDRISTKEDQDLVYLLMLANEHQMEYLKFKCQDMLCNAVDIDNALFLFDIASTYNAQQLQHFCGHFIVKNFVEISKLEDFAKLSPELKKQLTNLSDPKVQKKDNCSTM